MGSGWVELPALQWHTSRGWGCLVRRELASCEDDISVGRRDTKHRRWVGSKATVLLLIPTTQEGVAHARRGCGHEAAILLKLLLSEVEVWCKSAVQRLSHLMMERSKGIRSVRSTGKPAGTGHSRRLLLNVGAGVLQVVSRRCRLASTRVGKLVKMLKTLRVYLHGSARSPLHWLLVVHLLARRCLIALGLPSVGESLMVEWLGNMVVFFRVLKFRDDWVLVD